MKKKYGVCYTPDYAVEKSTTYLRNIINSLPDDNYLIIDRCAGTGNLEKFLTDEELSHCILNTINYAELTTLKGLYEGRVKAILPVDETTDTEGCMPAGDALQEQFNNDLINLINAEKAKNPNLTIIMLENPPYSNAGAGIQDGKNKQKECNNNYIADLMKQKNVGRSVNDMANKFIWSAFELIKVDYYVVYSPVKYFKSQNLVNKHFIEGIIVNRKDFHATEAGISLMVWKNEPANDDSWQLENCLIKRIKSGYNTTFLKSRNNNVNTFDYIIINNDGCLNAKSGFLINNYTDCHAKTIKEEMTEKTKQALPLFAANCYVCKDFTEKEVIMKSGDGGTAYQNDQEFLEDCFLWCCLTDKNKCISNGNLVNETAISQNSKADQLIDLTAAHRLSLKRKWDLVLLNAKACEEYNPEYKYGLAQIISELSIDKEIITSFKEDLKEFYSKYIEPKCFEYELLK